MNNIIFIMTTKAISPFISSVILIAAVAAIGVLLFAWFSSSLKTKTTQVQSTTQQLTSCIGADFMLQWQKQCELQKGLVGWWHLDSVNTSNYTLDSSNNGNEGKLYNYPCNPATCNLTQGKIGNALSFDGVDDYVEVDDSSSLNPEKITIAVWIKIFEQPSHHMTITTKATYPDAGYILKLEPPSTSGAKITFFVSGGTGHWVIADNQDIVGKWVFITAVFDGSEQSIWVNGEKVASESYSELIAPTTKTLQIGSERGYNHFDGIIDEVRIYNRALSEAEIKQLYYNALNNSFNVSFTMFYTGTTTSSIGKEFTATILLKNGTTITKSFILEKPLGANNPFAKVSLQIKGYYPSYGKIKKLVICSKSCSNVCAELGETQC